MKKFKFQLQKVLEVREIHLKRCQKELAELDEQKRKADKILRALEQKSQRFAEKVACQDRGCAEELEWRQQYLQSLFDAVERQKDHIIKIEKEREKQRQTLLKAHRNQKILENLRQQAYDNYLEAAQHLDQNLMDELANLNSLSK